jgi:predicted RNase H-like nuclease (RuvC/YqgF family)
LSLITPEPRDTKLKTDNQIDNTVDPVATEPPDTSNLPAELEVARADYDALLESSTHITNKLRQEVQELRSELEKERVSREEIEAELSKLKQNSAPAATLSGKLTPDAATILSKLARQAQKIKN